LGWDSWRLYFGAEALAKGGAGLVALAHLTSWLGSSPATEDAETAELNSRAAWAQGILKSIAAHHRLRLEELIRLLGL
jgi:hypothetical protein